MEGTLYLWIDTGMRRAHCPFHLHSPFWKEIKLLNNSTSLDDFELSWLWFNWFNDRRGLKRLFIHGKRSEVDREDLDFYFYFWVMSARCWKHTYGWRSLCTWFRNSRKRCHFQWVWAYIMYNEILEYKDQLLCSDVQAQAGNDYNELQLSPAKNTEHLQRKIRKLSWKQNANDSITNTNLRFVTCLNSEL